MSPKEYWSGGNINIYYILLGANQKQKTLNYLSKNKESWFNAADFGV